MTNVSIACIPLQPPHSRDVAAAGKPPYVLRTGAIGTLVFRVYEKMSTEKGYPQNDPDFQRRSSAKKPIRQTAVFPKPTMEKITLDNQTKPNQCSGESLQKTREDETMVGNISIVSKIFIGLKKNRKRFLNQFLILTICISCGGGSPPPPAPPPPPPPPPDTGIMSIKGGATDEGTDAKSGVGIKSSIAVGIKWKIDKKYIVNRAEYQVDGQAISFLSNDTVANFFQTQSSYAAEVAPGETWVGFVTPEYHSTSGASIRRIFEIIQGASTGFPVEDTLQMVYIGLVDDRVTYDILNTANSAIRYRMLFNIRTLNKVVTELVGFPQENGRWEAGGYSAIPTNQSSQPQPKRFHPKPGDLVISEIMPDPNGDVMDASGEWFEVTNVSGVTLDIGDLEITDGTNDRFFSAHVLSVNQFEVPPSGIVVLGRSKDGRINGGAKVDIVYGQNMVLANTADKIVLHHPFGGEIDRVEYNSSFPIRAGRSLSLKDLTFDNNLASSWETGILPYGVFGQFGTPSTRNNETAPAVPFQFPPFDADTGALVITEFIVDPNQLDNKEWFEVYNPRSTPIDLENLVVENATDSFTITDPIILDPSRHMVFTRSGWLLGGKNVLNYDYADDFALSNDNGRIVIRNPAIGAIVDRVDYNGNLAAGFPDYGDTVNGGWPIGGNDDGRSAVLVASPQTLSDPNFDNNDSTHWRYASIFELYEIPISIGGFGNPGRPNEPTHQVSVIFDATLWNLHDNDTTIVVDVLPGAGVSLGQIDTQQIRIFGDILPFFVEILSDRLRVSFNEAGLPPSFKIRRNQSIFAVVHGVIAGDTVSLWRAGDTVVIRDTSFPDPAPPVSDAAPGDLTANEVMVNGKGNETKTEWLEIYNRSTKTIDLATLYVQDGGGGTSDPTPEGIARITSSTPGPWQVLINPGEFKLITKGENSIQSGIFPLTADGFFIGENLDFDNTSDQVVIIRKSDGVMIDAIDYSTTNGFPSQSATSADGRSMALLDTGLNNDVGANWKNAGIPFGDGIWGTPKGPNNFSTAKDIQISEVYPNPPPGGEPNAEFFELANLSSHTVDLTGLRFTDAQNNTFDLLGAPTDTVSGGLQKSHILPGKAFVLGNSRGASDGVDATFGSGTTDYDYPGTFTLNNSGDSITIVLPTATASILIDAFGYTSAPAGQSHQIISISNPDSFVLGTPNPKTF